MESFELTFFALKCAKKLDQIREVAGVFNKIMKAQYNVELDIFDYEDNDFHEIRLSIYDFSISKKNFNVIVQNLTYFVEYLFELLDTEVIDTGIYELTFYYTEKIRKLSDFDNSVLKNFPLCFFKKEGFDRSKITNAIYESEKVVCIYNQDSQQIM